MAIRIAGMLGPPIVRAKTFRWGWATARFVTYAPFMYDSRKQLKMKGVAQEEDPVHRP